MNRKACITCSEVMLKMMQSGERTFTPEQILKRTYHPRCTSCNGKPGREFYCVTCDMTYRMKRIEVTYRGNPNAPSLWDPKKAHGLSAEPKSRRQEWKPRPRRETPELMRRICMELADQTEVYTYIDKDGRQRGQRTRTKLKTNAEIAERLNCSPEYVGQVRQWLEWDETTGLDQNEEGARSRLGRPPSMAEAIALRERRFSKPSANWRDEEKEFKYRLKVMIGHSRRYFRRPRTS